MIYDSYEWKNELDKIRKSLEKNTLERVIKTRHRFSIERDIFFSAGIVRKLLESDKMSDYIDNLNIKSIVYKPIKNINKMHNIIDDKRYDLNNSFEKNINIRNVCNYLIHSYVFDLGYDENERVNCFFVASDFDRNKFLYEISIEVWKNMLELVVTDDVVRLKMIYDEGEKDYKSVLKSKVVIENNKD